MVDTVSKEAAQIVFKDNRVEDAVINAIRATYFQQQEVAKLFQEMKAANAPNPLVYQFGGVSVSEQGEIRQLTPALKPFTGQKQENNPADVTASAPWAQKLSALEARKAEAEQDVTGAIKASLAKQGITNPSEESLALIRKGWDELPEEVVSAVKKDPAVIAAQKESVLAKAAEKHGIQTFFQEAGFQGDQHTLHEKSGAGILISKDGSHSLLAPPTAPLGFTIDFAKTSPEQVAEGEKLLPKIQAIQARTTEAATQKLNTAIEAALEKNGVQYPSPHQVNELTQALNEKTGQQASVQKPEPELGNLAANVPVRSGPATGSAKASLA